MLSRRLMGIANLVPNNSTVIDVGCDHGLLDIYLTLNKSCTCTATDVNQYCIDKTRDNVHEYNLLDKIKIVKTYGLDKVNYKKEDIIVLAGMGNYTIFKILKDHDVDNLIIQSNRDLEVLRKTLLKKYIIVDEVVVMEKKKYYVIIKFIKGTKRYKDTDYLVGPIIRYNKEYNDYKQFLLDKNITTYNKIPKKNLIRRMKQKIVLRMIKKTII